MRPNSVLQCHCSEYTTLIHFNTTKNLKIHFLPNFFRCSIHLTWKDERFRKTNVSREEVDMCYPGLVNPKQVDDLWKPDIFIDRAMGVS